MARKTKVKSWGGGPRAPRPPPAPERSEPAFSDRTRFVGRDRELAELGRLASSGARLLSLLGPGGAGKTRLARRWATASGDGGAWFCDLSSCDTVLDVLGAVARPLGVPLASGGTVEAATQLGHAIAARGPVLLLLDNFEQVVSHAAATVGLWLGLAPEARFLVTSREPLGLEGEARIEVPPLAETDGVLLLEERARTTSPGFSPTAEQRAAMTEIVRVLDGNALALELAAPRLGLLTPAELLERLTQRFQLLRATRRDGPERHSTLERAVDWSWRLLDGWEQSALAQCAVFRGPFSVQAAEAIVDLSSAPDAPPVVEALRALRDKSLLRVREPSAGASMRVGLDETVRIFAGARLDELGLRAACEARHARWYVEQADAALERAAGPRSVEALAWLWLELDDIVAVARARHGADRMAPARAALALEPLLAMRGPLQTWVELLDGIDESSCADEPALLSRLLRARSYARRVRGRANEARADLEAAIAAARRSEDDALVAQALYATGQADIEAARLEEAKRSFEQAIAHAERGGDLATMARSLGKLGELDEREEPFEQALDIVRRLGDRNAETVLLGNLGRLRRDQGRLASARADLQRAHDNARDLGDTAHEAWLVLVAAMTDHVSGDLEAASKGYEDALEKHRHLGNVRFAALALMYLGAVRHEQGGPDDGARLLEQALALAPTVADPGVDALALGFAGAIEAAAGRVEPAARRLASAREYAQRVRAPMVGASLDLLEGTVDAARAAGAAARDREAASRHRAAASSRMEAVLGSWASGGEGPGIRGTTVPIAARLLERALERADAALGAHGARARQRPSDEHAALEVERLGAWFRVPGGEVVDLRSRQPFRRLLVCLTEARLTTPGKPIGGAELIAVAWPGERLIPHAASNRLYNAIAEVRRLGLGAALHTRQGGYLLDPRLPVRWAGDLRL